ncbi:peroxiredoxin-like family protein [Limibacter armeniacum]|uniref:peroxiredoxin-like family protein n=1 Tax=Limibacter armeniacum TaxID=466084 RepID=UPI002FE50E9F
MKRSILLIAGILLSLVTAAQNVPTKAEDISPLLIGESVPEVALTNTNGNKVTLKEVLKQKPTVLVFYRGGWCPYCNRQLSGLGAIADQLVAKGFQIVAVSPDTPENLQATIDKNELNYTLLSDSKMEAARQFGISFKVSQQTLTKYKDYGINLTTASGESHNELPVPSVFIVDKEGKIHFEYINPDYSKRISSELLLAATEGLEM